MGQSGTVLVENFRGRLGLGAEFRRSVSATPGLNSQQRLLREEVELAVRGRVYDSRFLRYSAAATLAFTQTDTEATDGFKNLFLPSYALNLRFLPQHPTPILFYGRRDEDRRILESRNASPVVTTLTEEVGTRIGYRSGPWNASFEASRASRVTIGQGVDRDEDQDMIGLRFRHIPTDEIRTRGRYTFNTYRERASGQDFQTHSLSLLNLLKIGKIGPLPKTTFTSKLESDIRTGTSEFTSLALAELVRWRITGDLESRTDVIFSSFSSNRDSRAWSLSESIIHRLYQSLTTTLRGEYFNEKLNTGTIERAGLGFRIDYRKETAIGLLNMRVGYDFTRQNNDLEGGTEQVLNERHTLSDTGVVLLDNANVTSSEVIVKDATDTIVYTEGLDYELIPRGDRIEVVRIPGGLIADGQSVLVDYEFVTPADATFDTTSQQFAFDYYLFDTVRVFTSYRTRKQDLISGSDLSGLEDRNEFNVGAELFWRTLRALVEYTDVDSTSAPFTQTKVNVSYDFVVREQMRIGLNVTDLRTDFGSVGNQRTTLFAARLVAKPTRRLYFRLEPNYRIERGRGLDRNVLDVRFDFRYTVGKMSIRWRLLHQAFGQTGRDSSNTFTTIMFNRRW